MWAVLGVLIGLGIALGAFWYLRREEKRNAEYVKWHKTRVDSSGGWLDGGCGDGDG
jgi:hypothetical protein